jgi:hypothetical protein
MLEDSKVATKMERGLFRLWIVLSAPWIGLISAALIFVGPAKHSYVRNDPPAVGEKYVRLQLVGLKLKHPKQPAAIAGAIDRLRDRADVSLFAAFDADR